MSRKLYGDLRSPGIRGVPLTAKALDICRFRSYNYRHSISHLNLKIFRSRHEGVQTCFRRPQSIVGDHKFGVIVRKEGICPGIPAGSGWDVEISGSSQRLRLFN